MSGLIEQLTQLTALRNREEMDLCLAQAIRLRLAADEVRIARLLGDAGDERWLVGAQVGPAEQASCADPSWVELLDLPPLDQHPDWRDCMRAPEPPAPTPGVTLLPLRGSAGVLGVVEARTAVAPDEAALADVRGLLDIYRNLVSLLDYTECDTLTGLLNRKSFDDTFYRASALPLSQMGDEPERRVVREQRYWLGVVDIDHFKQVNDQHGHLIGDEVLLLLSRVMRQSFRALDKLYRFGGEEFVVLLRCPGEDEAMAALQRFRAQVEAFVFPRVQHVTVSVGYTDVRSGDTPPAAVERADMAVYYAKRHGRNQVRSHAALVREGELSDLVQTSDVEFF
ncbi:diguanylate cyclase [Ideonella sp. 4Y16]|uniref:diguanylate cyclase n=1 Tax=Ideonella alba TaxID=2824118 RepID=A0A941BGF6_9BURK|nr:GGDEF domain-containing protein [Ideonella alba]MBQ0930483.1 diguanylate cyclase [Ideonella alba]MBQ0945266.1 diguanylate cyclase [Ideonella alba]